MKNVTRSELLSVLKNLSLAVAKNDTAMQSDSFLFRDGFIWTYNKTISARFPIPKGLSFEGAIIAAPLIAFLEKVTKEELSFSFSENKFQILYGKATAGFLIENAPEIAARFPKLEKEWSPLPNGFIEALQLAYGSISRVSTGGVLSCAQIGSSFVMGCNNFQSTRAEFPAIKSIEKPFLLQGSFIDAILSLEPVAFQMGKNCVHFRNKKGIILSCQKSEGKYPDLSPFFEVKGKRAILPQGLQEVLDRAEIFSTTTDGLTLHLEESGLLTISAENTVGWIKEFIQSENQGVSFTICIDPGTLIRALKIKRRILVSKKVLLLKGKTFSHIISLQ